MGIITQKPKIVRNIYRNIFNADYIIGIFFFNRFKLIANKVLMTFICTHNQTIDDYYVLSHWLNRLVSIGSILYKLVSDIMFTY